jgi:hypothetical protein
LINYLADRFKITQIVFERSHQKDMIRYRLRKLGVWTVARQLAFLVWDRLFVQRQSQPRINQLLVGYDITPPDDRIPTCDVDRINSVEVLDLVRQQAPKTIVVSGTGIIGRKLLAAGRQFINIHCGITPRYRGVHGAFWAVVEGRPELAGTTVHLIDAGVDTGAIIAQATIDIEASDTYRTLPVKQYLVGLPLVAKAVEASLSDSLSTYQRDDLESRQWYSPTPWEYWLYHQKLRKLKSNLDTR